MAHLKQWRILAGFTSFLLLALITLIDFRSTVQANFADYLQPVVTQTNLPKQAGLIAGTSRQSQPGIVQTTRQIMARKQQFAAQPPRPQRRLPVKTLNTPANRPGPTNPAASPGSNSQPALVGNPLPAIAFPTVSLNFTGAPLSQEDIDSQVVPPDTMGAAGPTQFLMLVNGLLRTFDKATGRPDGVLEIDPNYFFSPVMTDAKLNDTNFPRVRYDRLAGRWILLMNDVPGGNATLPNRILLAVSSNSIITADTLWYEYYFQPTQFFDPPNQNLFADYPTLGVDNNALYIGVNLYNTTGDQLFLNTAGFVVRKSSILDGGSIFVTGFPPLIAPDGTGPYTPQGVDNLESDATAGYFIGIDKNPSPSRLQLRRVTNPGGTPMISANIPIPIEPISLPLRVPHKGYDAGSPPDLELRKLDPIDDRLLNATIRKGHLWTAHNIGVDISGVSNASTPDRDGSRWYEIDLTTPPTPLIPPPVLHSGTVYDPTTAMKSYWLPSLAVSGQGNAVMGFNVAGPDDYISAGTTGLLASTHVMQPPKLYITSASVYNPPIIIPPNDPNPPSGRRWGDYSYTSLDPDDDMTFWTIQEFAYTIDGSDSTPVYGLQIAKLAAPPPATPVSATPALTPGQASVSLTITGNSVDGSGFFEPGPDFPSHLKISIDGEITVNSITGVTPTSISLDVSTRFAISGSHSVTITNPDGQTITGIGLVNVAGYSCTPQAVDNDAPDGSEGSLRQVLGVLTDSGCKTFIFNNLNPVSLESSLTVPAGVTITTDQPCAAGADGKVEIDGASIAEPGDGLILNGGTFFGLYVHGFKGRQIVANTGSNYLKCVTAART